MPVLTHTRPKRVGAGSAWSKPGVIVRGTFGILALALVARVYADPKARQARAEDLKAVYLLNFAQFVEWPTNAFTDVAAPFVIGILGESAFGKNLDEIVASETVHNHKIIVRHYHDVQEVTACQILFIGPSESTRLDRIFETLRGRGILTVGETDDFSARGGMIRFFIAQNRLHLGVNLETAQAAQLVISSKLLRLADILSAKREE